MEEKEFTKGSVIFSTGEASDSVFIIKSGTVNVALKYKGKSFSIDCTPGDILGDNAVVFDQVAGLEKPEYQGTEIEFLNSFSWQTSVLSRKGV